MRYRFGSAEPSRTVLDLSIPERPLVIVFLAAAALVCLILGLAYAVSDGATPEDRLRAVCFTGFGLFCLCAIFLFATGIAFPRRLIFDNSTGRLVLQDAHGKTEGAVPYEGIAGFSVCRGVSEGIVRYSTGIDLRRGGRWELYASRAEEKAKAFTLRLSQGVNLRAPAGESPAALDAYPSRVSADGSVTFEWKRRTRASAMVVSIVAVVSFAAALVGTRPFAAGAAAMAAATGFALLLVAALAAGIARTAGERVAIEVGRGTVRWRRRSSFFRERTFTAPLSEIAAVDLSLTFSRVETAISLPRPADSELFARYRQGTFGPVEVPAILAFLRGLRRIDVSGLPAGQRLALAEALREAITRDAPRTLPAGMASSTPPA